MKMFRVKCYRCSGWGKINCDGAVFTCPVCGGSGLLYKGE